MSIFKFGLIPNASWYTDLIKKDFDFCYGPETLRVFPVLGLRVNVPADLFMVLVLSNGKRMVLDEGYQFLPDTPAGRYQIYFVAKRQENLLRSIDAVSADMVSMKIDAILGWKLSDPSLVTQISEPLQQFLNLSESAISEVFNKYKYEEIVGTIENTKPNMRAISQEIWRNFASFQKLYGISATTFKIRSVRGDSVLSDQTRDFLQAKFNKKIIEVKGETKTSEESYASLITRSRQQSLALEDARNNLAQEPQRLQERILNAMHEIGRVITDQANMDGASVPNLQAYSYKTDPAYTKAIEVAVTALRDLAVLSTIPGEIHEAIQPIGKSVGTSLKGNGHKRNQVSSLLPSRPPKNHARQKRSMNL